MSHEGETIERRNDGYWRAAAAEACHREHHREVDAAHHAALIGTAAECLATATRAWRTVAPTTRAEIDAVGSQLEGMRIALGNLRIANHVASER